MKVGPLHVVRDATLRQWQALQDVWSRFSKELDSGKGKNALADLVRDQTHALLHSPLAARIAPSGFSEPPGPDDAADRLAVERVIASYRKAVAESAPPPTPSMWDRIGREKGAFLAALNRSDEATVRRNLGRMFTNRLTWGLGQVDADHPELLRSPEPTHLHYRFTDTVLNLAEAVGAARVTSMAQNSADHLQPLNRNLDEMYTLSAAILGFDPSFPAVGSAYGFRLANALVSIDSLTHAYTAYRFRTLGAGSVFEIGGGYGCLAMMAYRAGVRNYAVFDLPWVNVLQGYFLLRALPAGTVSLYGEPAAPIRILPYWVLDREPDKSCDVAVNTDSLPEMGRATALGYMPKLRRVVRDVFLSINQEAKAPVPGVGEQHCVGELIEESGGWERLSRNRYWLRQGFVEEVYRPVS
ncbi:MAG TPA: hypothetical protein VGJ05_16380 [Fimbriiglobus sp.]|jgi:hypothetical protein